MPLPNADVANPGSGAGAAFGAGMGVGAGVGGGEEAAAWAVSDAFYYEQARLLCLQPGGPDPDKLAAVVPNIRDPALVAQLLQLVQASQQAQLQGHGHH